MNSEGCAAAAPPRLCCHIASARIWLGAVLAEVSGDEPAKAFVAEAGAGTEDVAESAGQGCGALIAEAQGSGSLAPVLWGWWLR